MDVPDEEKIIRTIAVDRTRKIKFEVAEAMNAGDQGETIPADVPEGKKLPSKTPEKTERVKR